jgi:hypothetical protein
MNMAAEHTAHGNPGAFHSRPASQHRTIVIIGRSCALCTTAQSDPRTFPADICNRQAPDDGFHWSLGTAAHTSFSRNSSGAKLTYDTHPTRCLFRRMSCYVVHWYHTILNFRGEQCSGARACDHKVCAIVALAYAGIHTLAPHHYHTMTSSALLSTHLANWPTRTRIFITASVTWMGESISPLIVSFRKVMLSRHA